jgi:hypothetical protein
VAKDSLRQRVLLSLAIALVVFFGATVLVLEWSLGASLARARDEVLDAQLMALIAVAEPVEATRSLSCLSLPTGACSARIRACTRKFATAPAARSGARRQRLGSTSSCLPPLPLAHASAGHRCRPTAPGWR